MMWLCFLPLALLVGTPSQAKSPEADRLITLHLEAVVLSDDDGGRSCQISHAQVQTWIDFSNRVYRAAGIAILFDPRKDTRRLQSTLLNDMKGDGDLTPERLQLGNTVAGQSPGKIAVLFRHGPGQTPTGQGFSWWTYNFVVMSGYTARVRCGHHDNSALAHELGHYFGLSHTFAHHPPFETRKEAERFLKSNMKNPLCFDGDGLSDTPPDPGIFSMACERQWVVELAGMQVACPRRNIMSFYDERDRLSPLQIRRVKEVLGSRLKHRMSPRAEPQK